MAKKTQNIVVTGANGFLGRHLITQLQANEHDPYPVISNAYDLRRWDDTQALFKHAGKVDTLYHLAAVVGGIGANRAHPAQFFYDNLQMGMNIIHASHLHGVDKIVMVGTTCSYPKYCPIPFREFMLFDGYPEETNAPYGIAKRTLLIMLKAYHQEYGMRFAYLIPTNLYGPGDNFDDNTSHVIPALIKKCLYAKKNGNNKITVWGDGKPTRDFLYVEDAARGIILAGEKYEGIDPLNLGSGEEISINSLVYFIKEATGFTGSIEYDTSKPSGQPRRKLDYSNAKWALKWKPEVGLKEGLRRTIEWYKGEQQ